MRFPRVILYVTLFSFSAIAIASFFKREKRDELTLSSEPMHVVLDEIIEEETEVLPEPAPNKKEPAGKLPADQELPEADRIEQLFSVHGKKFPFIETVTYKSRTDWQKGRPAWLSDYAGHYKTSRHFIARSLNGKPDYFKQDVANGDRFNVLKPDYDLEFYLVIDVSRHKMWFYVWDKEQNTRTLLKTYSVGLGREEPNRTSGLLTPLGRYTLGDKIAVYRPKSMGFFNGERTEMIRVFGTRWLPFAYEHDDATEPAKGLGIHGAPWLPNKEGILVEEVESVGKCNSDGCIRLHSRDVEELFAIVISRPTTVELVAEFSQAHLPGETEF